jgi:hypothetical protein
VMVASENRLATVLAAAPRTAAEATDLLCDHGTTPQPLCRHDEPGRTPAFPLVGSLVSLRARPGVPSLEVSAGNPCMHPLVDYPVE